MSNKRALKGLYNKKSSNKQIIIETESSESDHESDDHEELYFDVEDYADQIQQGDEEDANNGGDDFLNEDINEDMFSEEESDDYNNNNNNNHEEEEEEEEKFYQYDNSAPTPNFTNNGGMYQDFNILTQINRALEDYDMRCYSLAGDRNYPIYDPSCSETFPYTAGRLATELKGIYDEFAILPEAQQAFDAVIRNILPVSVENPHNIHLPYQVTNRTTDEYGNEELKYKQAFEEYVEEDVPFFKYDACSNGCEVFVGNVATAMECRTCGQARYPKCTRPECKYISEKEKCNHMGKVRKASFHLVYRSLILLIHKLLQFPAFLHLIRYVNLDSDPDYYVDVMCGNNHKKHSGEMRAQFQQFIASNHYDQNDFIHVPLNLQMSYDGAQIFRHRTSKFYPLFMAFLDLPPPFRVQVGAGMFALSLFIGKKASTAEYFIFKDCLMTELLQLNKGKVFEIGGKKYFVNARVISYSTDTNAVEELLNCKQSNCVNRCFQCNAVRGANRYSDLSKKTYNSNRIFLEESNIMLFVGQSKKCCPQKYYDEDNVTEVEWKAQTIITPLWIHNLNKTEFTNLQSCNNKSPEFKDCLKLIYESKKDPYQYFTSHHKMEDIKIMMKSMYFHHMDFRKQIKYAKVSVAKYKKVATEGTAKDPKEGYKGLWLMNELPYADPMQQMGWCVFHCVKNCDLSCIHCIDNERFGGTSFPKIRKYCEKIKCHPCTFDKTAIPKTKKAKKRQKKSEKVEDEKEEVDKDGPVRVKWSVTEKYLKIMDAWVNALIIPKGYKGRFKIKTPFMQTGHLNGAGHIHFVMSVFDYAIISAVEHYPEEYAKFFHLFSENITELLHTKVNKKQLERFEKKLPEFVSFHDGLFPESEANFIWHELIDIPEHIKYCGPCREQMSFATERGISEVKKEKPDGGNQIEYTCLCRFHRKEKIKTEQYFGTLDNIEEALKDSLSIATCSLCINGNPIFRSSNFVPVRDVKGNFRVGYTDEHMMLLRPSKLNDDDVQLNDIETLSLLLTLEDYVFQRAGTLEKAAESSTLFRVMHAYRLARTEVDANKKEELTFQEYLGAIRGCFDHTTNTLVTPVREKWFKDQGYYLCFDPSNLRNGQIIVNPASYGASGVLQQIDERGMIFQHDYKVFISKLIDKNEEPYFKISGFSNAFIHGVQFCSRGWDHRESSLNIMPKPYGVALSKAEAKKKDYLPTNSKNELRNEWQRPSQYNAWCKFRATIPFECEDKLDYYGQFNHFFQLRCSDDNAEPLIKGAIIASITARKSIRNNYLNYIIGDKDCESLLPIMFVPIINVYSTPIVLAAFHAGTVAANLRQEQRLTAMLEAQKKPYYLLNGRNKHEFNKYHANADKACTLNKLSYLVVLEMFPNRINNGWNEKKDKKGDYNRLNKLINSISLLKLSINIVEDEDEGDDEGDEGDDDDGDDE